jgi:hypothetical protein
MVATVDSRPHPATTVKSASANGAIRRLDIEDLCVFVGSMMDWR